MSPRVLDHPSAEQLAAFSLGRMDEDHAVAVESHLAACDTCRSAVDSAPGDTFVAKIQDAFATGSDGMQTQTLPPRPVPPRPVTADIPAELATHPRYRLVELLGAGGMGVVFKAEHLLMKRTVAVKVINRALFTDSAFAGRFAREMEAAGKLTHPNIVHAYDAEHIGDTHFLAMEYVEGVSLAKLLAQRGPLPVAEACSYIRQAALGLQHAHERGMVHRDIKPQNLMVATDGQVKILDFGLARFVLESAPAGALLPAAEGNTAVEPLTLVGTVMGTPAYIAPEQVRDPHTADIRADIYSLGCTLYDLLTGRPPFAEESARRKVHGHLREAPRSVTDLRPEVPRALAQVVEKMLAKDPARRFQTPAEVAAALAPWAGQTDVQPAQRPRRSRRRRLAYAATVVALLAAAGYAFVPPVQEFAQTVVRAATNRGVLVIEAEDKDLEITVKHSDADKPVIVHVSRGGKEVVELRAGELTIEACLPGGDRVTTTELTLARGGTKLLTARLLLAPPVLVSRPLERQVTDYEEFTGKIAAAKAIDVRPLVSGYLQKAAFREGDTVKAGQLLFVIDAKPIQALLEQAKARLELYEDQLRKTAKSVEAIQANIKTIRAEMANIEKELAFTRVRSPFDGRIGQLNKTPGNRVTSDDVLTTIVSEDPMYVFFYVPEATALRIAARLRPSTELLARLAGETDYRHKAVVDFVDNRVQNGTLTLRATIANPRQPDGHRRLTPGLSVWGRLPTGAAHRALLVKVPQLPGAGASAPDFVYVVDDQNKVIRRNVKWGQEHDGLRVVTEGLLPTDRVIVGWTEVPRPGDFVQTKLVEMPASRAP